MSVLQLKNQLRQLDQQIDFNKAKLENDKAIIIGKTKNFLTNPLTWVALIITSFMGIRFRRHPVTTKLLNLKNRALLLFITLKKLPFVKEMLSFK